MAGCPSGPLGGSPGPGAPGAVGHRPEWQAEQQLRLQLEREGREWRAAIRGLEERLARLECGRPSPAAQASEEDQAPSEGSSESGTDEGNNLACCTHYDSIHGRDLEAGVASRMAEDYKVEESAWDAGLFVFVECVGFERSLSIIGLMLFNMIVQVFFLWVVKWFMCEDPLSNEFLQSLLHFRASTAHNVRYADLTQGTSLASQICQEDEKLPWAGAQLGLVANVAFARRGGIYLCTLVVLCWLLTLIGELDDSLRFGSAVTVLAKGVSTRLVRNDQGDLKLARISSARHYFVLLAVVLPRLLICCALAYVGVSFLVVTTDMEELLLNSLALAFIKDVDNMLFAAFAPGRVKSIIRDLEPIPLPPRRRGCFPCKLKGLSAPVKLLVVLSFLVLVYWNSIRPVYSRMNQAYNILCSGDTDFVFAYNSALGFVEAAPSFPDGPATFTTEERTVLALAQPNITRVPGFEVEQDLLDLIQAHQSTVVMDLSHEDVQEHLKMPRGWLQTEGVHDLNASLPVLRDLQDTAYNVRGRNVDRLPCADMTASLEAGPLRENLRRISGGHGDCSHVVGMCSWMNMTQLRALCPVTCGCRKLLDPPASFFAAPSWGCPRKCEADFHSVSQIQKLSGEVVPCRDVVPEAFLHDPALTRYITKAMEFLMSRGDILITSHAAVTRDGHRLGIHPSHSFLAFKSIIDGSFLDSILNGRWELAGGYPHPRGLRGCDYWASWEVGFMLGMDFCSGSTFRSLRGYCPESCGCHWGGSQCPPSCFPTSVRSH